jgi:hypothetical protein
MQVHERYLGRTLRCTSCRAEFLAMLPVGADEVEPAPVEVVQTGPRRSWTRHLKWLVALIPLVLLVWWLGQDQSGSILGHQRSTGEIGALENDSGGRVFVALDPDSAGVLAKVGDIVEGGELSFLIEQGRAVEMDRGTGVRVLGSASRGRVVQVRILSGPWESRRVWVPTRWVR